jgi:cysteinyl-tRNA synthetase
MGDKRSVTDFALWKFSPADKKRQMEWDSPWGKGFPGWHIECSAMSLKYLTQPVDIHCGGTDHVRVHHTNEIAQTEAATGKQFVRYWMHGEFLTMAESKMAKSGGNFITLDSLKEKGIDPLAYRMFCYTAHYRSPLAFSWDGLAGSAQSLKNLRKLVLSETGAVKNTEHVSQESVISALKSFSTSVCDDLNMPRAMASLWELARNSDIPSEVRRAALASADEICALDIFKPAIETGVSTDESGTIRVVSFGGAAVDVQAVFNKIHDRREARKLKDFKKADVIRDELIALGIAIKDLPSGITECTVTSADS